MSDPALLTHARLLFEYSPFLAGAYGSLFTLFFLVVTVLGVYGLMRLLDCGAHRFCFVPPPPPQQQDERRVVVDQATQRKILQHVLSAMTFEFDDTTKMGKNTTTAESGDIEMGSMVAVDKTKNNDPGGTAELPLPDLTTSAVSSSSQDNNPTDAKALPEDEDDNNTPMCCICMEHYVVGDTLLQSPHCPHVFHKQCMEEWLIVKDQQYQQQDHLKCPLCQTLLIPPQEWQATVERVLLENGAQQDNDDTNTTTIITTGTFVEAPPPASTPLAAAMTTTTAVEQHV